MGCQGFLERAGARRGAKQGLRAGQRLEAKDRTAFLPRLRFYRVLVLAEAAAHDSVVVDGREDLIGIAFGAFADPSMPWPPVSVWETTPWVAFDHFERQPELIEGTA